MSTRSFAPLAAAVLALAGCGSAATTARPDHQVPTVAAASPAAPDPAAIVRQAGAALDGPASYDISGDRLATGTIHGPGCTGSCGEQITVYTAASAADLERLPLMTNPGDAAVITGHLFVVTVTGVAEFSSAGPIRTVYYVTPAQVAARVHGTVVIPGS